MQSNWNSLGLFLVVFDQMARIALIFVVHDKDGWIRLRVDSAVVQLIGAI